jgi:hypothetical protein
LLCVPGKCRQQLHVRPELAPERRDDCGELRGNFEMRKQIWHYIETI